CATDRPAARLAVVTLMVLPSLLQRQKRQFNATVLRAPGIRIVAGNRMMLAAADGDNAFLLDALAGQVLGNRTCTPLRKRLVISGLADAVGVASDFDDRLVVLFQNLPDAIQH